MPKKKEPTLKEHIRSLETKVGKTKMPSNVLKLNNWLYITCDAYCWIIKEVNTQVNPKTGEKYPDKCLLYSPDLDGIIRAAVRYMSRVPSDILTLSKKLDEIYKLIDERIPENVKPNDLFEVMENE